MRTILLTLGLLTVATGAARAQAPFPGAVEVCKDGERGWVPASHPMALSHPCVRAPENLPPAGVLPSVPTFLPGAVYYHVPYHIIWAVMSTTTTDRWNPITRAVERVQAMNVLQYQSLDAYHAGRNPLLLEAVPFDADTMQNLGWQRVE